jgi:hypothetical protein
LEANKYIDESAFVFALIDYIKNEIVLLLFCRVSSGQIDQRIAIEPYLILRPKDLLAPIWADNHFYAVIFVYEGGDELYIFYCDSNRVNIRAAYQDFGRDSLSCAARAAFNLIERMNLIEFRVMNIMHTGRSHKTISWYF